MIEDGHRWVQEVEVVNRSLYFYVDKNLENLLEGQLVRSALKKNVSLPMTIVLKIVEMLSLSNQRERIPFKKLRGIRSLCFKKRQGSMVGFTSKMMKLAAIGS